MRWAGLLLLLNSSTALAAPTVNITALAPGSMQAQTMYVSVTVVPGNGVLTKVQASIGNQTVDLMFTGGNSYQGGITIVGNVPFGSQTLSVTAFDNVPSQTTATEKIVHDELPLVTIDVVPINAYLPAAPVPYKLLCTDDDPNGCVAIELQATVGQTTKVIASGTTKIDQMVDFGPYADQVVVIHVHLVDSGGQQRTLYVPRQFNYVTNSPALCLYGAPIGPNAFRWFDESVMDADDERILTVHHIIDRANGTMTDIPTIPERWTGMLIPGGAIIGYYDLQTTVTGTVVLPNGFVPGGSDARLQNVAFAAFGDYVLPFDSKTTQLDISNRARRIHSRARPAPVGPDRSTPPRGISAPQRRTSSTWSPSTERSIDRSPSTR